MVKIGIIIGSTRDKRVSPQVADWVMDLAEKHSDAEFELVDIKDYHFVTFLQDSGIVNTNKQWS